ncbi:MAG: 3-dehydroquinate synthase family protein [Planctomycetota bacterium]|nr:3-dehydroquinate synthase family protein [Planctomycetota bacterium]
MPSIHVQLAERSYDVEVGAGVLSALGSLTRQRVGARASRAMLVHDAGLPAGLVDSAKATLGAAGFAVSEATVEADERHKTLATIERLCLAMARAKIERGEPLIALGGGIIGDAAGFAASMYRRGVPVVQCPTTLLSMVDASVGGKTGVNLDLGDAKPSKKNLLGAFHQPALVLADVSTLRSLPGRQLRCGLAECIKHGLLAAEFGDAGLLSWIDANLDAMLAMDAAALGELVARNVAIKAKVVAGDEREEAEDGGGRALLNLGHTFGHAIEPIKSLSPDADPTHAPLHHGEAVALGLVAACRCAGLMNLVDASLGERVGALLTRAGLPTRVRGLPPTDDIVEAMSHDKKVLGGVLRLVLPVGEGRCRVVTDAPMHAVRAAIDSLRA